jgi:hypothetical protein
MGRIGPIMGQIADHAGMRAGPRGIVEEPFPDPRDSARARRTPQGRCRVGAIVSRCGREAHDVWLEVSTGLVTLIRPTDA